MNQSFLKDRRRLRQQRRAPALLLLAIAALFIALEWAEPQGAWVGYLRAFAEAGLVGGLADWFAVTALFRHPLGIPIPHTAIIPRRKDEIGANLARFVADHFLTSEAVHKRLQAVQPAQRLGQWLARDDNAQRGANSICDAAAFALRAFEDAPVRDFASRHLLDQLSRLQVAPLLGKGLAVLTEGQRHQQLLTEGLRMAVVWLAENKQWLREQVAGGSPWWMPGFIDEQIFDKTLARIELQLFSMALDPEHPLRQQFDAATQRWVETLESDPEIAEYADALLAEWIAHPTTREFADGVLGDLKQSLLMQLESDSSDLRTALTSLLGQSGADLAENSDLQITVDRWIEQALQLLVRDHSDDIAALITDTVSTWDGEETAQRVEAQVGRDQQFIRINGTLVGGLVGLILHFLVTTL